MINDIEDIESGSLTNEQFTGVGSEFSNVQHISAHGDNVLCKAMRYGRWYMLKGIAPRYAHDEAHRQMLIKEFETMMKLEHPGIVQATSLEEVPGLGACIVMEYISGETLEQWLTHSPSAAACREIFMQILVVAEYIHRQGIVHRDLKLSNAMVTRVGNQAKIIDFGLADADRNAIFKHAAGTQGYISPEQAAGGDPDPRNDIYSLGVMLEKMLPLMGKRYRPVAQRCKSEIDNRYTSVGELRSAMNRADTLCSLKRIAAIVALVVAAGVALYFAVSKRGTGTTQERQQATSTVNTSVDSTIQSTDTMPVTIPVVVETPAPQQEPGTQQEPATAAGTPEDSRQAAVDQAIKEGERLIKNNFPSQELIHHLDTLTNKQYLNLDLVYGGLRIINAYAKKIKPRFSDTENATIYSSLTVYHAAILDKINKRIENIK